MTYQQTLDYMFGQLPMFQRVGKSAYKADLATTLALDELTGKPHKNFKTIHIAGTNGKGSTSHMLAAICRERGLKTGLYTSPHLKDFRERITINGEKIPEDEVISFVQKYRKDFELLKPSFFEMTVAMCFNYFSNQKVDIAIIETGLGGRLDSTNIITPLLSVITNIGMDHMDLLGNTLEKIAGEKAGIVKPGVPVVIGETHKETKKLFLEKAKLSRSAISFADKDYRITETKSENNKLVIDICDFEGNTIFKSLNCDLPGIYQLKNIKTVLSAVDHLNQWGFCIDNQTIRKALGNVKGLTRLMGRWQTLSENPLAICDTGHNEDGIKMIVEQIKSLNRKKIHMVFGVVNDKDVTTILSLLPGDAEYYFCRANLPRAMDAETLREKAAEKGLTGTAFPSVKEAFRFALSQAGPDDLVFVGGSTFVVAEVV